MDRKIYFNPLINSMENTRNRVYINRNFAHTSNGLNKISADSPPRLNPIFNKDSLISLGEAIKTNQHQYSNQSAPKIFINPKLMDLIKAKQSVTEKNVGCISTKVTKNKFSKVNPPKSDSVSSSIISTVPVVSHRKQNKICRSLVRKREDQKITASTSNTVLGNGNRSRYQITKIDRRLSAKSPNKSFRNSTHKLNNSKSKIVPKLNESTSSNKRHSLNLSQSKLKFTNFVYVSNERYVLHNNVLRKLNSKTLTTPSKQKNVKQISINGKTFIRKSENSFIRVNKPSVKTLKKNNIPCPIYRRLGMCPKNQKGKCIFVHDPKHVRICRKYLIGACKLEGCYLSHEITLEKMPTCKFYLEGCCIRDDCPYLHVKINDNTQICMAFLQGFCASGKDCCKMHLHVCPEFYKHGKCNRHKCPHPHKLNHVKKPDSHPPIKSNNDVIVVNDDNSKLTNNSDVPRYFVNDISQSQSNSSISDMEHDESLDDACNKKEHITSLNSRPKLGALPSFIAL